MKQLDAAKTLSVIEVRWALRSIDSLLTLTMATTITTSTTATTSVSATAPAGTSTTTSRATAEVSTAATVSAERVLVVSDDASLAPPPFTETCTTDADRWLSWFEKYALYQGLSDGDKATLLGVLLKEESADWHDTLSSATRQI